NKAEAGQGVRLETAFNAKLAAGDPDGIELSKEVVEQMKVETTAVKVAEAHRSLQLAGSLALDPDKLTRVRSRFAGEVTQIASVTEPSPTGTKKRGVQFGDHVTDGQLLGTVYS